MRENFGTKLLCSLLILCGFGAFCIKTMVEFDYWYSVGNSFLAKVEYGGGSIVFSMITFLFAAVVASQWRKGKLSNFMIGAFAAVILTSFAGVGITSIIGFGSRERIVPYAQAKADRDFALQEYTEAKTIKKDREDSQIKFLRAEASRLKKPANKQAAYDALGNATFGTTEIIAPPKLATVSDPQAEAIQRLRPDWEIESIQFWTTFAWGIALYVAEIVCMGFGVALWPAPQPRTKAAIPVADKDEDDDRPSAEIIRPEQFAARPAPAMAAEEPVVDRELDLAVDEVLTTVEQIEEFWKTQTRPAAAARIQASTMYRAYTAWCGGQEINPASQQLFGRESKKLGYDKDKSNKSAWFYVGRALIGSEHESLMVA